MPQTAIITASTSGDTPVVPLVLGKRIVVKAWSVSNLTAGAQAIKWRSNTTDLTGLWGAGAVIGLIASHSYAPGAAFYFRTAVGEALNLNLAQSVAVGGSLQYELE